MSGRMITLVLPESDATLESVRRRLGLRPNEIDPTFDLVSIDPAHHLYAIRVTDAAAERVEKAPGIVVYSDPRVQGLERPKKRRTAVS